MCFFFFKQKTAYEMRISDWSSDVCSSDLVEAVVRIIRIAQAEIDAERMGQGHVGQDRQFKFAIDFPDLDSALRFENPLLLRQLIGTEVERLDTLLDADREPDRLRRPGALDAIGAKFAADARVEHRSEAHTSELQS